MNETVLRGAAGGGEGVVVPHVGGVMEWVRIIIAGDGTLVFFQRGT